MRTWMKVGLEVAPQCGEVIRLAPNAMSAWIALNDCWPDLDAIGRDALMRYSRWCLDQCGAVSTAVQCAFIEHVTEDEANWSVFRQHYKPADIMALMPLWAYCHKANAPAFASRLCGRT